MIKVYSHPRSGTNFLMTLIAMNFYQDIDLSTGSGYIGHWSCRKFVGGNKYGKLFGGHKTPKYYEIDKSKSIYIIRDGRDVAISLWRSENFKNKKWKNISLSDFIKRKIDWIYTPGQRTRPKMNIAQHWKMHILSWVKSGVKIIKYENLLTDCDKQINIISGMIGCNPPDSVVLPPLSGWFPNDGKSNTWQDFFTEDDNKFFLDCVGRDFYGLYK